MADEDIEDLRDQKGRLKRGLIALAVGIACAVLAYGALYALARPDSYSDAYYQGAQTTSAGAGGPWKFVFYFTGVAFMGGGALTLGLLQFLAKRRWQRERFPQAKLR